MANVQKKHDNENEDTERQHNHLISCDLIMYLVVLYSPPAVAAVAIADVHGVRWRCGRDRHRHCRW